VRSHYDIGNEFYALWLDQRMIYSCAYFETGTEDLDTAQAHKLEYLCRKLRLQPGEHLLDIGCGWGGLLRYATEHYGVRGVGITVSAAQAAYATDAIRSSGLAERCTVQVADYRDLDARRPFDKFDKIVSVGMYEHVGRASIPAYFAKAHRLLRPGGLFLNHGIVAAPAAAERGVGRMLGRWLWGEGRFIDRYVFPDGELTPIAVAVTAAEHAGFEVRTSRIYASIIRRLSDTGCAGSSRRSAMPCAWSVRKRTVSGVPTWRARRTPLPPGEWGSLKYCWPSRSGTAA
jgi:cyclopropane-fatty-acyl-phospholipid synthase